MVLWILIAYGCIALLPVRPFAGHFAWSASNYYNQRQPDGSDWALGYGKALLVCVFWPLFIPVVLGGRMFPQIGAEKAHVIKEQAERIRELEREPDREPG